MAQPATQTQSFDPSTVDPSEIKFSDGGNFSTTGTSASNQSFDPSTVDPNEVKFSDGGNFDNVPTVKLTPQEQMYNDAYHNRIAGDQKFGNFNAGPLYGPTAIAANSVLGGFAPELVGGEQALGAGVANLFGAHGPSMSDTYHAARQGFENSLADYSKAHPLSSLGANIAGIIPGIEGVVAHGLAWGGEKLAKPVLGRILGAATSSGIRGVGNSMSANQSTGDVIKSGAENAALGGLFGSALEGVNSGSNMVSNLFANPKLASAAGKLATVGGTGLAGAGTGALGAMMTGGDVGQSALLGGSLGAAGGTMMVKNAAKMQTGPDAMNSTQREITAQKMADAYGGNFDNAVAKLRASNSPTTMGAMGQKFADNLTPDDFNDSISSVADKQQKAIQAVNDAKSATSNDLKQAIENHTGVSQDDAATSVGTPGRYTGYSDPMANIHNVYTSIDAGHFDPQQFSTTTHGQLFDKNFPDTQGNINDAFNQYGSEMQNHSNTLDQINKDYDLSKLSAPVTKSGNGDVKQAALFGALAQPHNPIAGAAQGALGMYDFTKTPEVINATTPVQSQGFAAFADKSPKSTADFLENEGSKIMAKKAQIAAKNVANQRRAPLIATTLASLAPPQQSKPSLNDVGTTSAPGFGDVHVPFIDKKGVLNRWNPDTKVWVKTVKKNP